MAPDLGTGGDELVYAEDSAAVLRGGALDLREDVLPAGNLRRRS